MKTFSLIVFSLFFTSSVSADEVKEEELLNMADQFTECAAAFEGLSILSNALENHEIAKSWHELSNGWLLSGLGVASVAGYQKGYVEEQHKSQVNGWKSMMSADPEITFNKLQQKVSLCKNFSKIQEEILKEIRRNLYKSQ